VYAGPGGSKLKKKIDAAMAEGRLQRNSEEKLEIIYERR